MVLASGSPRRLELLGALCDAADVELVVDPADVDETEQPGERPTDYVRRLAVAKAEVVVARRPGTVVVGADTTVDLDGHILAKPVDAADAGVMLARLSARTHRVHTGVAVVSSSHTSTAVVTSFVSMAPLIRDPCGGQREQRGRAPAHHPGRAARSARRPRRSPSLIVAGRRSPSLAGGVSTRHLRLLTRWAVVYPWHSHRSSANPHVQPT